MFSPIISVDGLYAGTELCYVYFILTLHLPKSVTLPVIVYQVLNVTVRLMKRDHDRKAGFHPRPYFRLFVTWLMDFNSPDSTLDSSNFQVLK